MKDNYFMEKKLCRIIYSAWFSDLMSNMRENGKEEPFNGRQWHRF